MIPPTDGGFGRGVFKPTQSGRILFERLSIVNASIVIDDGLTHNTIRG